MKKVKWQAIFQFLIIVSSVIIGMFFSCKSAITHLDNHKTTHAAMGHGSFNICNDSVIPQIEKIEFSKDPNSGWNLFITTKNFQFTPENINANHVPGCGHAHLYINGKKAARIYSNWFHLPEFDSPIKDIEITLNSNTHAVMCFNEKPISLKLTGIE